MKHLVMGTRLIFGAWMLANGANHFFFAFWPMPVGHEPLAAQLMDAAVHSRLFDVAMAIQLVTGALILAGAFVPLALCVVMPVSTCALFWSAILDRQAVGATVALVGFVLNGALMLAYIDHYRGVLVRHAPTLGEASGRVNFESAFVHPNGRTTREEFIPALIVLLAVVAFYALLVTGRTALWSLLVIVFPAVILHTRRLHDLGHSAWLLLLPAVLMVAAFAVWLGGIANAPLLQSVLPPAAFAGAAGFAAWGCIAKGTPRIA
jgi:uncharacterized membrane protein YhaH (DUF805 family)